MSNDRTELERRAGEALNEPDTMLVLLLSKMKWLATTAETSVFRFCGMEFRLAFITNENGGDVPPFGAARFRWLPEGEPFVAGFVNVSG